MIPLSHGGSHSSSGGGSGLALYFNRMVAYSQMDLQYHLWQMLYLVVQPARVYRISALHRRMLYHLKLNGRREEEEGRGGGIGIGGLLF